MGWLTGTKVEPVRRRKEPATEPPLSIYSPTTPPFLPLLSGLRRHAPTPDVATCPKPEEVQAMLNATRALTERAALLLMATSGLRRAKLLPLTWNDVELPDRRLRIHGKGDRQREVLIFDDLPLALYGLQSDGACPAGPVNRGRQGRPLQLSTLNRWFRHWLRDAGLADSHYTPHSLRRFAAKRWLESGLNIRQVQMLLGHENLQTTILYLNYDLDEIQRAAGQVNFGLTPNRAAP